MTTSYPLQTNARTSNLGFFAIALLMLAIFTVLVVGISVGGAPDLSVYGVTFP